MASKAQSSGQAVISGVDRAAIFLMTLGEDTASAVLKHLGPKEVQSIGTAMAAMPAISRTQLSRVVAEFTAVVEDQTPIGVGSDEYLRKVLNQALGEDRARSLIDRILVGGNSSGLESLKWMDGRAVADMIRDEHPQIMAIVVSYLDSDHGAEVLGFLPDRIRSDVIMRIASLESIHPSALQELDQILERQFSGTSASKTSVVGGLKRAADILNLMDSSAEAAIIDSIKASDESLGGRIQELMFTFENLLDLDDRSIQRLLREVSSDQLVIALKGATAEIKALILRNMSKRAAESLQEDLEMRGPTRVSEVEAAQKEILGIVRRLSEEGEIAVGGKGGDDFV
ncbi:MAG: flagellar motor switch protein FliG [Gammaproteobacteria bacterium]|nr:flagellar motor switch protein FliG [Gammaproteobacteria bacterium]